MSKTRAGSMFGTLIVIGGLILGYMVFTSESPKTDARDQGDDRRVVLRWLVRMGIPADVHAISVSNLRPLEVHASGLAAVEIGGDIVVKKNELLNFSVAAEIPKIEKRSSVSCQIWVNSNRVVHNARTVRTGDDQTPGVICVHRVQN